MAFRVVFPPLGKEILHPYLSSFATALSEMCCVIFQEVAHPFFLKREDFLEEVSLKV
jgi:ABC-type sulfate transport system permease component